MPSGRRFITVNGRKTLDKMIRKSLYKKMPTKNKLFKK
ncbi:hypothetical protein CHCC14809_1917 [Bacillus licheniformis]|nr:hypothetical protein CHCC20442_0459 [Bacillus licheniformis]TWM16947.1 hypothetical protein CHCC15087_1226 [Bacillus licheniformis]TWM73024.1 hypothetical protein CHCC14809_1917 [Bacillus licheniformis]TWM91685.1 hypothetical protein CHCC14596_3950 [Bacillus licheniformis]TWM93868.1 hypothetical protein CHCC14600_1075 [Bacillus licheniformis]